MNIDKLRKAIRTEGLVLCASKNHGKTNALQVLCSDLNGKAIVVLIDYASQHCFHLEGYEVKFMNEKYWLKPNIDIEHNIILDFSQTTKHIAGKIIRDIIKREYLRRVKLVIEGFRQGKTRKQIMSKLPFLIFAVEESSSLIGRYLKSDDNLNTSLTCGRNYRIAFMFLTQRVQSLNAELVEKCSYLIGKQLGSNNLRRISNILGIPRGKLKFVESLPQGEFIFYTGSQIEKVKFPLFEGNGRAYEIGRELLMRKKKGLWQRMKQAFKNNHETLEQQTARYEAEDNKNTELEEEEDAILF